MSARAVCPRCGGPLWQRDRGRPAIGRPFEECARCKAFVPRAGCNEWDFLRPGARARLVGRAARSSLLCGVVAALMYASYATGGGARIEPLVASAAFGAGTLLAASWLGISTARAIRRSRHRLSDPMYRSKLVEYELAPQAPKEREPLDTSA